jgi:hypothetical protein
MATLHPPEHLLIAAGSIREAVRMLAAAVTFTRILEFNPLQGATLPQIPKLRIGTPLNTTRRMILG